MLISPFECLLRIDHVRNCGGRAAFIVLLRPLISPCIFGDGPHNRISSRFNRHRSMVLAARCSVLGQAVTGQMKVMARHPTILYGISTGPRVELFSLRYSGCP